MYIQFNKTITNYIISLLNSLKQNDLKTLCTFCILIIVIIVLVSLYPLIKHIKKKNCATKFLNNLNALLKFSTCAPCAHLLINNHFDSFLYFKAEM